MKNYQIFLIRFLGYSLLIFLLYFSITETKIFQEISFKEKLEENLKKLEDVFVPLKEKTKIVTKLPEKSLKANLKIKENGGSTFSTKIAFKEYNLYLPLFFGWKKVEIRSENFEKIKNLIEILKEKEIFEKFEVKEREGKFKIDEEKLKEALSEWEKNLKLPKEIGKLEGKFSLGKDKKVEKIEIETKEGKIIVEFENINLVKIKKEEDLENLILCLLTLNSEKE